MNVRAAACMCVHTLTIGVLLCCSSTPPPPASSQRHEHKGRVLNQGLKTVGKPGDCCTRQETVVRRPAHRQHRLRPERAVSSVSRHFLHGAHRPDHRLALHFLKKGEGFRAFLYFCCMFCMYLWFNLKPKASLNHPKKKRWFAWRASRRWASGGMCIFACVYVRACAVLLLQSTCTCAFVECTCAFVESY